jgi:hypothetical protein
MVFIIFEPFNLQQHQNWGFLYRCSNKEDATTLTDERAIAKPARAGGSDMCTRG